ncbi:MAG: hypothetical protein C4520_02050 [Candidatus Abyssobacteria bacterium SURF_5]|uniref:Uncharacterized protein n=1 Tax=Abyssobacteria bacterium (strain SURF_5) TaxID=2093360 RepID=A0A3A4P3F7_ABYX5|nr:MAG: hypothetical protein C4520_02050 [Candidatus Abyssubacteria bacterium SURF_5]
MSLISYGIPILGIIGFAVAAFSVFTGILNPEKMGISQNVLWMFGVSEIIMAACWAVVLYGLLSGSSWPKSLALLITGMYLCNYLVSLAMFKNMGDKLFKYWGTIGAIVLLLYCIWI